MPVTAPSAAAKEPVGPQLSIVVPVYYNEENLPTTVPTLAKVARSLVADDFELIMVDDGSGDRSFGILEDFQKRDSQLRLRIVKLTRNFGSMAAIQAGLAASRGAAVVIITADLQDPPELIGRMHENWVRGAKCVYAVRSSREEGLLKTAFANIFYALLRRYALPGYPEGGFDFCLLDRQVVADIVRIGEKNAHVMNLIFWLGYPAVCLPYVRRERQAGRSRWTLAKKLKLFADSFVAFSFAPIRAVTLTGFVVALLAGAYGVFQVYNRLIHGAPVQGFTTIVTLIALTSGIQMMMLGVLGEYLWRTLDATRQRPQYIIERTMEPPTHA